MALRLGRPATVVLFTALALVAINAAFNHAYRDSCSTVALWRFCLFADDLVPRSAAAGMVLGLFAWAQPRIAAPVLRAVTGPGLVAALWLIPIGLGLVTLPALLLGDAAEGGALLAGILAWTAGALVTAAGLARLLAPWPAWGRALGAAGLPLFGLLALALALPEIGDRLFPLWHVEAVTEVTFGAVLWLSSFLGMALVHDTGHVVGQGDFFIKVNQSCSGIEGFALITVFLAGYMALFRRQLAFPRVFLILPMGIALSWVLNVVRITGLVWVGLNVSPELAVEGFHSHAGWLMFSTLAIGTIFAVQSIPWFQRSDNPVPAQSTLPDSQPLPIHEDWNAARLLPFAVFMGSALVASTFFVEPAMAYPLRLAAMAAALWPFRNLIFGIEWRLAPPALGAGAVVGLAWILTAPASTPGPLEATLSGLGTGAFLIWAATRIVGTAFVVPLIEELFFRSYLLDRLGAGRSLLSTGFAVALSTAAFAALHDRWPAAALAGLVFAWAALRPGGRLADAIAAHALANLLIATHAALNSDWTVI